MTHPLIQEIGKAINANRGRCAAVEESLIEVNDLAVQLTDRAERIAKNLAELVEICRSKCGPHDEIILPSGKTNERALIEAIEALEGEPRPTPSNAYRLKADRRFRTGVTTFEAAAGSIVRVTQRDERTRKVLLDFGNGLTDWFHESILESLEATSIEPPSREAAQAPAEALQAIACGWAANYLQEIQSDVGADFGEADRESDTKIAAHAYMGYCHAIERLRAEANRLQ